MRIGFDAKRIVSNGTGLGSYGRTLVNDLATVAVGNELTLYAPDNGKEELRNMVSTAANITFAYPRHNKSGRNNSLISRLRGDIWRTCGIVKTLQCDGIDIYHGLSGELPLGIKKSGIKSVVTIHDLIFLRHPEYYNRIDVAIYSWKFRKTIAEADRIIAISECTKRDIIHYGNVDESKIDLVYQSCGTHFKQRATEAERKRVKEKYNLPERYVINLGTIEERKNAMLAVKAMRHVPDYLKLVIAGRRTPYVDKIKQYVTENRLENRIILLHNVPYADLPALYQMAEVSVYPSRYEGFGIPIIESIQSGLPVVACSGSCLEEAGGNDNIYVDPDDDKALAHGICQSLRDTEDREERILRSQQYVRRFENNNVAAQVLDIYKKLL